MILLVVRHGETDYNTQGRYAGSTDVPLNSKGFVQAKQLSEKLSDRQFDVIVCSPLLRARQTAEIINTTHPVPLIIMNSFAERNLGVYEGLTRDEAKRRYPDLWERKCTSAVDDAPTDGETIRQFDQRIVSGLRELNDKYSADRVLLVCHGFASRAINRYVSDLSYGDMHSFTLENCGIAEYVI